jgi:hypothetical protein
MPSDYLEAPSLIPLQFKVSDGNALVDVTPLSVSLGHAGDSKAVTVWSRQHTETGRIA